MPPEVQPIPMPEGRGFDALEWMCAHGCQPRVPTIRSSDVETLFKCPFAYYLTARLGIAPALHWSEALSHGSWFHKRLELWDAAPTVVDAERMKAVSERQAEIEEIAKAVGIVGESLERMLQREADDAELAFAWFEALKEFKLPGTDLKDGFMGYLTRPWWRKLATEALVVWEDPKWPQTRLVGRLDNLLYHEKQNTLWILDAKTTKSSCLTRMSSCSLDFQTWHYIYIVKKLLETGVIHEQFDLPKDVRLGGMLHLVCQKPTIRLSRDDRNFTIDTTPYKSGPNKGLPKNKKVYEGEPLIENYIERCARWYQGTEEYLDKRPEREADPPVNISRTSASVLDGDNTEEYNRILDFVYEYATCDPIPKNFPRMGSYIRSFGGVSPYAPFYLTEPAHWPEIMQREGFIYSFRDEDINAQTDAQISED